LGFAELPSDAAKELTEMVFGVMQRVRRHAESSSNAAPDTTALGIKHLTAADLILWTQSQPGHEGGSISEPGHICADFTKNGLGCDRADTRDVGEIPSEDAIQLEGARPRFQYQSWVPPAGVQA
jgi:hypothetical protein